MEKQGLWTCIQLLNSFNGRKNDFAVPTGGGRYFYRKFKKREGIKHYLLEMENLKR